MPLRRHAGSRTPRAATRLRCREIDVRGNRRAAVRRKLQAGALDQDVGWNDPGEDRKGVDPDRRRRSRRPPRSTVSGVPDAYVFFPDDAAAAHASRSEPLTRRLDTRGEARMPGLKQGPLRLPRLFGQHRQLGRRHARRLLEQHMLAPPQRRKRDLEMGLWRRADRDNTSRGRGRPSSIESMSSKLSTPSTRAWRLAHAASWNAGLPAMAGRC